MFSVPSTVGIRQRVEQASRTSLVLLHAYGIIILTDEICIEEEINENKTDIPKIRKQKSNTCF